MPEFHLNKYLKIQLLPHSKHTALPLKNTNRLILFRKRIVGESEETYNCADKIQFMKVKIGDTHTYRVI
jgi:hypothetical protein